MDNSDSPTLCKPEIKESIAKLEEILLAFRINLSNLHQKIEIFESKPELQTSIEYLQKDANSKAMRLEAEVAALRKDLNSIKTLLGLNFKENNLSKS
jgi:hypothetical protein